uniref:Uncharacterized protein n=1 Tax=Timema douglasi TaxID=61478 RepID=A0A7R8VBU1_TIMDO|nr:unnamed protein product [Timema douglasi]
MILPIESLFRYGPYPTVTRLYINSATFTGFGPRVGSSGAAMSCGVTWVAASLKRGFYKLGVVVGRHPGYFLIIPALLSLACVTGYQRIKYEIDPEYLFSPVWGEGKAERAVVEEFFKPNYTSRFNVGRITRPVDIPKQATSVIISIFGGIWEPSDFLSSPLLHPGVSSWLA